LSIPTGRMPSAPLPLQLYTPSQGLSSSTSWASANAPRELSLVLHGTRGSSTALPLGLSTSISTTLAVGSLPASTSTSSGMASNTGAGTFSTATQVTVANSPGAQPLAGATAAAQLKAGSVARPFTDTTHPDVFVVQWAGGSLGHLLRADLKMAQSGLGGIWGARVLRVAVRELGAGISTAVVDSSMLQGSSLLPPSADTSVVEFDTGNQWLGPAPPATEGDLATSRAAVAVGTQSLRLLPAGLAAFTFNAR
jgi:hypothetical protein